MKPEVTWNRLLDLVRSGQTVESAAGVCVISVRSVDRRRARDKDFAERLAAAVVQSRSLRYGHGSHARYKAGCRCELCRSANAEIHRQLRKTRRTRTSEAIPHGPHGYSNYLCRCEVCSTAHREQLSRAAQSRYQRMESAPHGTAAGYTGWGCRCDACRAAYIPDSVAKLKARNESSRDSARRHGRQWTGPELELALRRDLTSAQVAEMLGRSIFAVQTMRQRLKTEPMLDHIAGASCD